MIQGLDHEDGPWAGRRLLAAVFVGTVVVAYGCSLHGNELRLDLPRGRWCLAWGVFFAALNAGYIFLRGDKCRFAVSIPFLAVDFALLCAILWTSRLEGAVPVCVYPLLGLAVAIQPPLAAGAASVLLFGAVEVILAHFRGAPAAWNWAYGLLPGFAFVIVFTKIALSANAARLKALALAAEVENLATVRERNRLAHEIHDSLGHFLTTIHVQLGAARAVHAADPERSLSAVAKAQDLAREALGEVRRSVAALQADAGAPLAARLEELIQVANACGPAVTFDVRGASRPLPLMAEHALYRAAQEGLTNVRKHAQARAVSVLLDYADPARVRLELIDDGRGAAASASSGYGLDGLRERIAAVGGRVDAGNASPAGFRLCAEIPA